MNNDAEGKRQRQPNGGSPPPDLVQIKDEPVRRKRAFSRTYYGYGAETPEADGDVVKPHDQHNNSPSSPDSVQIEDVLDVGSVDGLRDLTRDSEDTNLPDDSLGKLDDTIVPVQLDSVNAGRGDDDEKSVDGATLGHKLFATPLKSKQATGRKQKKAFSSNAKRSAASLRRTDSLLLNLGAFLPRSLREAVIGDIREDLNYYRKQAGWPEFRLRLHILWQFFWVIVPFFRKWLVFIVLALLGMNTKEAVHKMKTSGDSSSSTAPSANWQEKAK